MAALNMIEFGEDGTVLMRWRKDDGGWHRASCPPGSDLNALLNQVDQHLISMGSTAPNAGAGNKSRALLLQAQALAAELKIRNPTTFRP